ncbi:hypothetical protein FBU30_008191 [Linnemannia zychae]|nr:hypothetical protein FBU30_008191 [Linnemannia zychae]
MAPRKKGPSKPNTGSSGSNRTTRNINVGSSSQSSSSAATTPATRRSSRRQQGSTSASTLTHNATKSYSKSVDESMQDDISEDSDFQSASSSIPSALKSDTADISGNKRHATEKNEPTLPKRQRQKDIIKQESTDNITDIARDQDLDMDEQIQDKSSDMDIKDEESGEDNVNDPEYNPDYYSSDDDQEWIEVPVPVSSVQKVQDPIREVNALHVLALWWKDSFVVTGSGIESVPYADLDVIGVEAAMPVNKGERINKRKNLQRRLLNRSGSSDISSQLFTAICRSLGLRARLVESLQACTFKITLPKDESAKTGTEASTSSTSTNPPVFWTEVYAVANQKWITIDPVRGVVNSPLKMHPANSCTTNNLAYVVAYDEDGYVTDVTRRYTSQWTSVTKKLRVQPAILGGFDWWAQTMSKLANPLPTIEKDLEEAELLQSEAFERMPTKLSDFNNHPIYALERHLKKFEVLHPKHPVLGHIRGEAIYPRSCVKYVRSKENWLKRARQIKSSEAHPVKWIKSRPTTVFQMRLRQQTTLSGDNTNEYRSGTNMDTEQENDLLNEVSGEDGDQIALFGEWQTEPYQPPWVVNGKVPRNQYGRQDVFTPAMVPIGGTHLKGRNIARVARQLGVDFVEAVTGFEFQSRRSIPVIQGIIVPTESAELVMDAYREVAHHADQEAYKRKQAEIYRHWRQFIKGVMLRSRLIEEYGKKTTVDEDDEKDGWIPLEDSDEDGGKGCIRSQDASSLSVDNSIDEEETSTNDQSDTTRAHVDSGGGFMLD